jgi:hypothetical protein
MNKNNEISVNNSISVFKKLKFIPTKYGTKVKTMQNLQNKKNKKLVKFQLIDQNHQYGS